MLMVKVPAALRWTLWRLVGPASAVVLKASTVNTAVGAKRIFAKSIYSWIVIENANMTRYGEGLDCNCKVSYELN